MNVLVLTNPSYEGFVYRTTEKYADEHLILIINNKADFERFCKSFSYDIGISFMYLHKVPAEQVNTHPWFNFHPAPLPEYKGRNLCYHAIMNGEKEFGATVHYMDENFDTGDIIDVRKFPIYDHSTSEDVSKMALNVSEALFMMYFPLIIKNTVFSRLPNRKGSYYKKTDIIEEVPVRPDEPFGQFVRAVTYKNFYPRIDIGGVRYKIVRDE